LADDSLARKLARRLPSVVEERRVPYPEVGPVLSSLASRHGMAIVTNGEPEVQARKIAGSGLSHYFEHVVLADNHGGKPDAVPFEHALCLLRCEASEVAMIGNSIATDIAGARNVGIFSVWVNRQQGWNETPSGEIQPDATVGDLAELLALFGE
jgi:putative hydrolase of the HAD superfamily